MPSNPHKRESDLNVKASQKQNTGLRVGLQDIQKKESKSDKIL